MKITSKTSFLFRYRYHIGYVLLTIAFALLLCFLPSIAPNGISEAEMDSAVHASQIGLDFIQTGNVIDFPYYIVQKISLNIFGLSLFSIELPSIIFGIFTAILIAVLINRWFKTDVAILGSILTILSTAFLFLATYGTPNIMYLFWMSLLLWLGSKIIDNNHVHPMLVISFFVTMALSVYTPHLGYIIIAIGIAGLLHPHLRHSLTQIKKWQAILSFVLFAALLIPLVVSAIMNPSILGDIMFTRDFSFEKFFDNIATAFAPFFSFSMSFDSVFLAPLFGLGTLALIFIGFLASLNKLFTSSNTLIDLLIIFSIVFSGINQNLAILIIIPVAVLSAAGIESIYEKWHSLFPENPYAHFIGNIPVLVVMLMGIFSGLSHFVYGYHYTPTVVKNFVDDIAIIEHLDTGSILVVNEEQDNFEFYKLFEEYNHLTVTKKVPKRIKSSVAVLGGPVDNDKLILKQIITSPMSRNSDRLYIYEKYQAPKEEAKEETKEE